MGSPSNPGPERWDAVCLSFITLATAVLAALFTLVGFADEVLASPDFRAQTILVGALAVGVYFTCLGFAYQAIFADAVDRKKAKAQDVAAMFLLEVVAVVGVAFFVIWAKL